MLPKIFKKARDIIKSKNEEPKQMISVSLDKNSYKRYRRLKKKIKPLTDERLLNLSLKSLEQKTDRIIIRQVRSMAEDMKNKNYSDDQIADLLNIKGFPHPGDKEKWEGSMISNLLHKKRNMSGNILSKNGSEN
jgi:hypothetical protein